MKQATNTIDKYQSNAASSGPGFGIGLSMNPTTSNAFIANVFTESSSLALNGGMQSDASVIDRQVHFKHQVS